MATKDIKSQINVGIKLTVSKAESAQLTRAVKSATEKAEAERSRIIRQENKKREREEERFQTFVSKGRAKIYRDEQKAKLRDEQEFTKTRFRNEEVYRSKEFQLRLQRGPRSKDADMERGFREIERSRRASGFDPGGQTLAEIAAFEGSAEKGSKAAARAAQARARQVSREDDKTAKQAAKEREAAKRAEAMDLRRAMKQDQRAERERGRKASAEERAATRAEVRRSRAEAQASFAEGGEDPRVAEMNAASPGAGDRWAAAQRDRGRGRSARQAAVEMRARRAAFSRGIHGIGALAAGVASGSPPGGVFGGGYGGFLAGSAAGFGGVGALAMGGLGAIGGGAGALGVMGMRMASSSASQVGAFQRAFGMSAGVSPTSQGQSWLHRWQLGQAAKQMAQFGLAPEEAAQIFSGVAKFGGWGGDPMMGRLTEAAQLHQSGLGVSPDMVGMIEAAGRRGGMAQARRLRGGATTDMANVAVKMGFQGSEVGDFVGMQAGMMTQARGMNTLFSAPGFNAGVRSMIPSVGQASAANIAGGISNSLMGVATGGVGGAGDPMTGLMLLQSFGGLKLRQRGGVGAGDIWNAQKQIESRGFTPGGMNNLMGRFRGMAAGRGPLANILAQAGLGRMGATAGPGRIESLMRRGPANDDVASSITSLAEGATQASALAQGGGIAGRAGAITAPENIQEAGTAVKTLTAGEMAFAGAKNFDAALAEFSVRMATAATAVDDFKAALLRFLPGMSVP